jgi:hypothetical protein
MFAIECAGMLTGPRLMKSDNRIGAVDFLQKLEV